jgi:hypothetical protein
VIVGLFALCLSDDPEEIVECALSNLKLWQKYKANYLIDTFAITQLELALKILQERNKNNEKENSRT